MANIFVIFVKIHFSTLLVFYLIVREGKTRVCRRLFCIASLHPEASPDPAPHLAHLVPKQTAAVPELLRRGAGKDAGGGVPQLCATELRGFSVLEDYRGVVEAVKSLRRASKGLNDVTILVGGAKERDHATRTAAAPHPFSLLVPLPLPHPRLFFTSPLSLSLSFSFSFSLSFNVHEAAAAS